VLPLPIDGAPGWLRKAGSEEPGPAQENRSAGRRRQTSPAPAMWRTTRAPRSAVLRRAPMGTERR